MGLEKEKPKNGADFVELISQYVIDNEILRPDDLVVKSTELSQRLNYILSKCRQKIVFR
jgi:ATP-dependent DNA helicase RecQ